MKSFLLILLFSLYSLQSDVRGQIIRKYSISSEEEFHVKKLTSGTIHVRPGKIILKTLKVSDSFPVVDSVIRASQIYFIRRDTVVNDTTFVLLYYGVCAISVVGHKTVKTPKGEVTITEGNAIFKIWSPRHWAEIKYYWYHQL